MSATWTVVSQNQSVVLLPGAAGFQDVWEVSYQILSGPAVGTVAMVVIPEDLYTTEYVKQKIEEAVGKLSSIANL